MALRIDYRPPPSLEPFLLSKKYISLVMGPVGGGKTTAGIIKIAYHAAQMAPCKDGIRRSRCIWVRQTRDVLRDTSIPDFLKWFPDGEWGYYLKSEYKYVLRFGDVECEVLFRWLEDSADVRRVLSLQASFAVIDEFREIHPDIYSALQARLGRYPDASHNGKGCVEDSPATHCKVCWALLDADEVARAIERSAHVVRCPACGKENSPWRFNDHLWGMTNPPDEGTFWARLLQDPPPNVHVTMQPDALSEEADWLEHLPRGYYENLAQGKSEEWVNVYIRNRFGRGLHGRPVHALFDPATHVASQPLEPVRSLPLIIGADAGLTPACVITQLMPNGQLRVLDELTSEGMGALRFVREKLIPLLNHRFYGMPVQVVIDPAAFQRSQADERSVALIYRQAGFDIRPARTNALSQRIAALDELLGRSVHDHFSGRTLGPAVVIDPRCRVLIEALRVRYAYKKNTRTGEEEPRVDKTHPHSDVCESLHYVALEAVTPGSAHTLRFGPWQQSVVKSRPEVKPAPVRVF